MKKCKDIESFIIENKLCIDDLNVDIIQLLKLVN